MNRKTRFLVGLIICLSLLVPSCVTRAALHSKALFQTDEKTITVGRTYEKVLNYTYDIADFEPVITKVEKLDLKPTQSDKSEEYYSKMEKAISLMNAENYKAAIEELKLISQAYQDNGLALYNLGICYANLKEYEAAIKYLANSYAAGCSDAFRAIDNIHGVIAFDYMQKKDYPQAIRYFKTVPANENVSMNVVYSYMELAKTMPRPKNLIMILYAGNYIVDNGVLDKNILGLGGEIGRQLGDAPVEASLPNAIAVMEYLVKATGDAWLHISLGMLYEHAGRPAPAKEQYQEAVKRGSRDREVVQFANGRLVEMEAVRYAFQKDIVFTVALKSGGLEKAGMDWTVAVAQGGFGQAVTGVTVTLNGKPVEYRLVKDRYGAEFVTLTSTGGLKTGENTLSLRGLVERSARRFRAEDLGAIQVSAYDRRSPQYKLYTESSKIYNLSHPLVKKALADIKGKLKKTDVASVVKAVYDYVIDKMTYELYDNAKRSKEEILDRLQQAKFVGLCEDYAVFTASLLRAFGIPALVLAGPTFGSEIGHAWPVFFIPRFDQAIALDTTWGDTGQMPNYYFLFNTNQNVVENVAWDSDVLPEAQSCSFRHGANIDVAIKYEKSMITK